MKSLFCRCALVLSIGFILAGCGGGGGQSAPEATAVKLAVTPSVVSFTVPAAQATAVSTTTAIMATFNEDQDPATISSATFHVEGVTGTVAYDAANRTAVFTPAASLQPSTAYTAVVTTGVRSATGVPLGVEYRWSFSTGTTADISAPSVTIVTPAAGAGNVPGNSTVSATFSEIMDPASFTIATFTLKNAGGGIVPCEVSYSGRIATLTPQQALAGNATFTATISGLVRDLAGNHLGSDYSWSFTTGSLVDTVAPTVTSTTPFDGTASVPLNRMIAATFSEPVAVGTVTTKTFTLQKGSLFVAGAVAYIGETAIFAPLGQLEPNTLYTVTLAASIQDLSGNHLVQDYRWSFTTGIVADTTAATIQGNSPANDATGVARNAPLSVTFNEDMNPFLLGAVDGIPAIVSYDFLQKTYSMTPTASLHANTRYTARIRAVDLAGNATSHTWSFTTGAN